MRQWAGGILSAIAGAIFAYAILELVTNSIGNCVGGDCSVPVTMTGAIIGATLLYILSAFLWRGAFVVGPVVGLLAAGGLTVARGNDIDLGLAAFIAVCVLLGPAILVGLWLRGRSKAKLAAELVQTGQKAVAHVQGVRETGVFINHRPQIAVDYVIHPLSGQPAFAHAKKQILNYGAPAPRPGLAWPAWYDPADHGRVAIGAPSGAAPDPQTQALAAEFGLTLTQMYGYDPSAGQQGFGVPGVPTGPGSSGF